MSDSVAPQFVGHHSPWLTTICFQKTLEETLGCLSVSSHLQKHINHFSILIDRSPKIVLLAPDLHEDFIYEEGVAIASVTAFQTVRIAGSKLDAPQCSGQLIPDTLLRRFS